MEIFLYIVIAVFVVFCIVAVIIIAKNQSGEYKKSKDNRIHVQGGADIERGYVIDDNNYFKGLTGEIEETVYVNNERRKSGTNTLTIVMKNISNGTSYKITVKDYIIIGRMKDSDVYSIPGDTMMSKRHCMLFISDGYLYLRDMESSNHTYLNGKRIRTDMPLKKYDHIKIGRTELVIYF